MSFTDGRTPPFVGTSDPMLSLYDHGGYRDLNRQDGSSQVNRHDNHTRQPRSQLADHLLREALHRPYYPSPLSQSPLQASISSASRTAASIASTSRTTTSTPTTTTRSTGSRFSVQETFGSLNDDDLDFFDRLISQLPPDASDFGQLKRAYNDLIPEEIRTTARQGKLPSLRDEGGEADWDTHLWASLLSLVKVRGQNWHERWDSVRLALGLEPRSGGDTDTDNDVDDDGSSTQSPSRSQSETDTETPTDDASISSHGRDHQHDSGPDAVIYRHAIRDSPSANAILSSNRVLGLFARLDSLPRSTGSSASTSVRRDTFDTRHFNEDGRDETSFTPKREVPQRQFLREDSDIPAPEVERKARSMTSDPRAQTDGSANEGTRHLSATKDPISAIQERLSRMLNEDDEDHKPAEKKTHAESSRPCPEPSADTPSARLPAAAKRRFDDLVRSSQSERLLLRQTQLSQREAEEEIRLQTLYDQADLTFAHHLLKTCLAWWITLTRRDLERNRNAIEAHDRVTLAKAWDRWKSQSEIETKGLDIADQTNEVRCKLTAFRRWKRVAATSKEKKEELKKEHLRKAYYATASGVKTKLARHAFRFWRTQYLHRLADCVRTHHLQAGAFALWQLRTLRYTHLASRATTLAAKVDTRLLGTAWITWCRALDDKDAVESFQQHRNRQLVGDLLDVWRRKALLSRLSEAFSERRIQSSALQAWKEAVEQHREMRARTTIAERWRVRNLMKASLATWQSRLARLDDMQRQAEAQHSSKLNALLHNSLIHWQVQERKNLFVRIRASRSLESAFYDWRQRFTSLITSLQQRESTVTELSDRRLLTSCFAEWKAKTQTYVSMNEAAQLKERSTLLETYFESWRAAKQRQDVLHAKSATVSEAFTLRSAFTSWRAAVRSRKAATFAAQRSERLTEQVLDIWRLKLQQKQREESLIRSHLAKMDLRRKKVFLARWVARVIEIKNRELTIKEQRERRLTRAAFYAWIEACLRHDEMLALMNSYLDVKAEGTLRTSLHRWLTKARESKSRKERLAEYLERKQESRMCEAWEHWQDKYHERTLGGLEYEMLLRRQRLVLASIVSTWKAQTTCLPAIQFRNSTLKQSAMDRWRHKLPFAKATNDAVRHYQRTTLQKAFGEWKAKYGFQKQLKAAARFGGTSMDRLKALSSAAAAANKMRSSSPSTNYLSSSSPLHTPRSRPRSSMSVRTATMRAGTPRTEARDGRSSSPIQNTSTRMKRSASLPRSRFDLRTRDDDDGEGDDDGQNDDMDSPSKIAAATMRRTKTAPERTATTSTHSPSKEEPAETTLHNGTRSRSRSVVPRALLPEWLDDGRGNTENACTVEDMAPTTTTTEDSGLSSLFRSSSALARTRGTGFATTAPTLRTSLNLNLNLSKSRTSGAPDSASASTSDSNQPPNSIHSAPIRRTAATTTTRTAAVSRDSDRVAKYRTRNDPTSLTTAVPTSKRGPVTKDGLGRTKSSSD